MDDIVERPPRSRGTGRSATRSTQGCLTCRKRKVRCDQSCGSIEAKSPCGNCIRLNLDCHYAPPGARRKRPRKARSQFCPGDERNRDLSLANPGSAETRTASHTQQMRTSVLAEPPPYTSSQDLDFALEQNNSTGHLAEEFGQFANMFTFQNEPDWQSTFPSGMPSPVNNLFVSSLISSRGVSPHPDCFPCSGSNDTISQPTPVAPASQHLIPPTPPPTDNRQQAQMSVSAIPLPEARPATANRQTSTTTNKDFDVSTFDITEHQRSLLQKFTPVVNPIPLLVPLDSQWKSAYYSLMSMARNCSCLVNAICAISELHSRSSGQRSIEQALTYYQRASGRAESILNTQGQCVDDQSLKQAFATVFLLMHTEMMAQPLAGAKRWPTKHLRTSYRQLRRYDHRLKSWTGISSHILSWIQVMDSKAIYAAGMECEPDRQSTNVDPITLSSLGASTDTNSPAANSVHLHSNYAHTYTCDSDYGSNSGDHCNADPSTADRTTSAAEIAYDALNTPAYKFFLRCQAFIPRIISLDLHHRPRGSLDAEFEVLQIGQRLRRELNDMWARRPRELSVLADCPGLRDVLHPEVARKIIQTFRIYVANFHALRILLHRVAFVSYPATEEVKESIAEVLALATDQLAMSDVQGPPTESTIGTARAPARSRKGRGDAHVGSAGLGEENRSGDSGGVDDYDVRALSPGTPWLWPMFMCGLECSLDKRRWILQLMYDMKGVNAERTAILLAEVTRRQDERDARVDQRSVRADIFEDDFSVVY